eukprot:TRINITY_DN1209_c0_g1_i1.p1 TRINITY_DN1209_c0_g1~~TRINITY_DN1209_c0_g1_i1.p1  ORF type:complete len:1518 (+),score=425.78 TRINITY_DN1209_c0_g1_i1:358-4554(+)
MEDNELVNAAKWIYSRLERNKDIGSRLAGHTRRKEYIDGIATFLHYVHNVHLDIILIQTNHFHTFKSEKKFLFEERELWILYDLDQERMKFDLKKKELLNELDEMISDTVMEEEINLQLITLQKICSTAVFDEDLGDVRTQLKYFQRNKLDEQTLKKYKLNLIVEAEKYGLLELIKSFGHDPVTSSYPPDNIDVPNEGPEKVIEKYIENVEKGKYSKPKELLSLFTQCYSILWSYNINLRKALRSSYQTRACVSTEPTERGKTGIETISPLYKVKYIWYKPLEEFRKEDFLLMLEGENSGLLRININVPLEHDIEKFKKALDGTNMELPKYEKAEFITSFSDTFTMTLLTYQSPWNSFFKETCQDMLFKHLFPIFKREIKTLLIEQAKYRLEKEITNRFTKRITRPPLSLPTLNDYEMDKESDRYYNVEEVYPNVDRKYDYGCYIMGVSYETKRSNDVLTCVMINPEGNYLDSIKLEDIMRRERKNNKDIDFKLRGRINEDVRRLGIFIERYKPHAFALAASSLSARRVEKKLMDVVDTIEHSALRRNMTIKRLKEVIFVPDHVAKIFQNSKKIKEQYSDLNPDVLLSLGIARHALNPLLSFCSIGNDATDLLSLKLHTLQDNLSRNRLCIILRRCLSEIVCKEGVDINWCITEPFFSPALSFVSGLGPRKAHYILSKLRTSNSKIFKRTDLLSLRDLMDKVIHRNCSSFLIVQQCNIVESARAQKRDYPNEKDLYGDLLSGSQLHMLDLTRIPSRYYDVVSLYCNSKIPENVRETFTSFDINQDVLQYIFDHSQDIFPTDVEHWMKSTIEDENTDENIKLGLTPIYEDSELCFNLCKLISNELKDPFKTTLNMFQRPSTSEVFEWVMGENEDKRLESTLSTMRVDRLIDPSTKEMMTYEHKFKENNIKIPTFRDANGKTLKKLPYRAARGFLENGLYCNLNRDKVFKIELEEMDNVNLICEKFITDRGVIPGRKITCSIIQVNRERFSVDVSILKEDIEKVELTFDRYFFDISSKKVIETSDVVKYTKLNLSHPDFKNVGRGEAINYLKNKRAQDFPLLFRLKRNGGYNNLAMTMKLADGVYYDLTIKDEDSMDQIKAKRRLSVIDGVNNKGNTSLMLFSDLEHLKTMYIMNLKRFLKAFTNNSKFIKATTPETIIQELRRRNKDFPNRIGTCYAFCNNGANFCILNPENSQYSDQLQLIPIRITNQGYSVDNEVLANDKNEIYGSSTRLYNQIKDALKNKNLDLDKLNQQPFGNQDTFSTIQNPNEMNDNFGWNDNATNLYENPYDNVAPIEQDNWGESNDWIGTTATTDGWDQANEWGNVAPENNTEPEFKSAPGIEAVDEWKQDNNNEWNDNTNEWNDNTNEWNDNNEPEIENNNAQNVEEVDAWNDDDDAGWN